jgi:hypothetical protein
MGRDAGHDQDVRSGRLEGRDAFGQPGDRAFPGVKNGRLTIRNLGTAVENGGDMVPVSRRLRVPNDEFEKSDRGFGSHPAQDAESFHAPMIIPAAPAGKRFVPDSLASRRFSRRFKRRAYGIRINEKEMDGE